MKLPLILDGATGTELFRRGMPRGACPEKWALENSEIIAALAREYADAGAGMVLAPTFGASRVKLEPHGLGGSVREINKQLIAITKSAVPHGVLVAGDMSPFGLFIAPFGDETMESLISQYTEQASGFDDADSVMVETSMTIAEARAAVIAAKRTQPQKPIFVSFTCDSDGRTMAGADVCAALVIFETLGAVCFGLNCGSGPAEMLPVLQRLTPYAGIPLMAKPNAGLPETVGDETHYNMTPAELADFAREFASAGVGVFGGCCGTTPAHIASLTAAVSGIKLCCGTAHPEFLASERAVLPLSDAVFSNEIAVSEFLADDFADCAELCPCVRISEFSEVALFEESQHGAMLPICIACDDEKLLEAALVSYNGRAAVRSCAQNAAAICVEYGAYLLR